MTERRGQGPADEPFHCTFVHVIHRTEQERRERWSIVNQWMQAGSIPTDPPSWAVVTVNHGGGGGP